MNRRDLFKSGLASLLGAALGIGPERQITRLPDASGSMWIPKYTVTLPPSTYWLVINWGVDADTSSRGKVRIKLL